MDTKWNSTEKPIAAEGTPLEGVPLKEGKPRKGRRVKALAGFLAFALGMTLTVSSAGSVGNRLAWERDVMPRFTRDWQETENFRQEVASLLRSFLTIGAGGELDYYSYEYWRDYGGGQSDAIVEVTSGGGGWWRIAQETDYGIAASVPDSSNPSEPEEPREPDAAYQHDKNVLYYIQNDAGETPVTYTNAADQLDQLLISRLEGYNFYLLFNDGKVRVFKNQQEVDVYGDGIYDGDSQWFVPGYDNFPSTEALNGVSVRIAVREAPVRYQYVDYKTGQSYNNSAMYYLAQRVEEMQQFYRTQAILFGLGALWLLAWFALRKSTEPVDRKIASWTVHVWTEARFLLVLLCGAWAFLPGLSSTDFFWALRYGYAWDYMVSFSDLASDLTRTLLANVPALLTLIWLVWLLRNDHRYNPKEARRSLLRPFRRLFRALRARDLKRPIEKRLARNQAAALLGLGFLALGELVNLYAFIYRTFYCYGWRYGRLNIRIDWLTWFVQLPLAVLGLPLAIALVRAWQSRGLAKDVGRLADQVEAVRAGDLNKPLILPEDADLRQTAESLNDIQAGMKAALEEQTRSERMKVELVSNVSHDLKTPLTSILSYAELLRQEDLPPAAADYARILDEKAQRLKTMVEDVFEISKAAADQLPVHLERLDLAKLLRQTLADMDGPIQKSALAFKVDLPEEPVMISADGKRLYRVFQNLIDNALRYALEGSRVYLSLKTIEEQDAGLAQVSVRNTSRSELPAGVDFTARFVRGDASRTDGGSGLGLSIASSFTEACGGTFRVETVADLFTAVVTFPVEGDETRSVER